MLGPIFLILFLQVGGEAAQRYCALAIPGPVIGLMLLLMLLLITRSSKSQQLTQFRTGFVDTASGLLRHLSLLFVPIGVGVIMHLKLLETHLVSVLIVILLGTVLTMIFTGYVFLKLMRRPSDG